MINTKMAEALAKKDVELFRQKLLAVVDAEIKEVVGSIANNQIWMHGSEEPEEEEMFIENNLELEEYKKTLLKMREQIIEGEFGI